MKTGFDMLLLGKHSLKCYKWFCWLYTVSFCEWIESKEIVLCMAYNLVIFEFPINLGLI